MSKLCKKCKNQFEDIKNPDCKECYETKNLARFKPKNTESIDTDDEDYVEKDYEGENYN